MITERWVRIPVFVRDIVPIGVGSAKIYSDGNIEIVLPTGTNFGKRVQQAVRNGEISGLLLSVHPSDPEEGKPVGEYPAGLRRYLGVGDSSEVPRNE